MNKLQALLLSLTCATTTATAQSYDELWKQIEQAEKNDLPKTALQHVTTLEQKAQTEGNTAQLLKAYLMKGVYLQEISPDSVAPFIQLMEESLSHETRPVVRALYHAALTNLYNRQLEDWQATDQDSKHKKLREHFTASFANLNALAQAKTKDWLPLFNEGKRSLAFDYDLLHTLYYHTQSLHQLPDEYRTTQRNRLIDFYQKQGKREAVILLELDRLQAKQSWGNTEGPLEQNDDFALLLRLAHDNADQPANVFVYEELLNWTHRYDRDDLTYALHNDSLLARLAWEGIRLLEKKDVYGQVSNLRNRLAELTTPALSLKSIKEGYYPGTKERFEVKMRACTEAKLRIFRLTGSAVEYDKLSQKQGEAQAINQLIKKQKAVLTQTLTTPTAEAWKWKETTVEMELPKQPGVYVAMLTNGQGMKRQATFRITANHALLFNLPNGGTRLQVVNEQTGNPVQQAQVTIYTENLKAIQTLKADQEGRITLPTQHWAYNQKVYLSSPGDEGGDALSIYGNRGYTDRKGQQVISTIDLFTDRAIYRPGQTIYFAATAYESEGDDFRTQAGLTGKVLLYDSNYKQIDSLNVRTDEWGTLKGEFRLSEGCLPGRFKLEFTGGAFKDRVEVRVEEYKRPTFTLETTLPETAYRLGDSIRIQGKAMTYTGVPLADAKITYTVLRKSWGRWNDDTLQPQTGETRTCEDGSFALPVHLTAPLNSQANDRFNRYTFEVNYTVTADNGETQEGQTWIQTATAPAFYEVEMPATICREHLPEIQISLRNAAGKHLGKNLSFYLVDKAGHKVLEDIVTNGETFRLSAACKALSSGVYYLVVPAQQGAKERRVRFVLFSENDTRPADSEEKFFAYTRPTNRSDSAFVLIGTPERKATLFYDLVSCDRVIESRQISLSDSLVAFSTTYRPDMGDGATLFFAMVRDGKLYKHEVNIEKPKPEKRLVLEWESFRSLLEPGQEEEWTLRIAYPDGTPAPASLLACLYDSSLDAFGKVNRDFSAVHFTRRLPSSDYRYDTWEEWATQTLRWSKQWKAKKVKPIYWTHWNKSLYQYGGNILCDKQERCLDFKATSDWTTVGSVPETSPRRARKMNTVLKAETAGVATDQAIKDGTPTSQPRSNFAETAFFLPQLRTDSTGRVSLAFRLPESLTRWHFTALAHTRTMDFAQLDTQIVARKTLMAEANLPRFVRQGDHTLLPVKVTNLSDQPMKVQLNVTLEEWQSAGKQLINEHPEVELAAKESKVIEIPYTCRTNADALRFRVTARGEQFSDGEERLLPVLSDQVEVTRTLPFSLLGKGTHTVDLSPLHKGYCTKPHALTLELSSNPTWYAVTALPVLAGNPLSLSATDWAERFYALALGEKMVSLNPEIRSWAEAADEEVHALTNLSARRLNEATPWAKVGDELRQRSRALTQFFTPTQAAGLRRTALDKLRALQQGNGSWSWCPGMQGHALITIEVAIQLARVQRLAENYEAREMLDRSLPYLRDYIAQSVKDWKLEEKRTKRLMKLSEVQLRYLYLLKLLGERPDADAKFLLERAAQLRHELSMYGKAIGAVVLAEFGYDAEARLNLESLLEHTVTAAEKGRWFDTDRALMSSESYRIPTQCATIEALAYFGKEIEADEMRRWLIQAKRTQALETSRATADAVYALLSTAGQSYSVTALSAAPLSYALTKGRKKVAESTPTESATPKSAGYIKRTFSDKATLDAQQLRIDKPQDGTSWGCVYASYRLPAEEVLTEGKDLLLRRRWEIWREGSWQRLAPKETVHVGDRLRQVYNLRAERDFDFVSLNASRAACLEPVKPLSGYHWERGLSIYRAVHDASTDFFIERLPKGDHELTEELFVVRAGQYTTGIARTQSVYAPEFAGTTAAEALTAE